jgi:equilibrative nucleoside transporter 1/2/3
MALSSDSEPERWDLQRQHEWRQQQQQELRAATQARAELDIDLFALPLRKSFTLNQLKYVTFTMIGMLLLWPWNCFLTALAYYAERFAHLPLLARVYLLTMMSILTVALTVFNFYLLQLQTGVDYNHRVNLGLLLTIGVFVLMACTCVLEAFIAMPDKTFFVGLMAMVLVLAMATCVAQNGTMAIANVMGAIYANAVMVGQAVAGVLPSVAMIASVLAVGEKPQGGGGGGGGGGANYGVFVYYITALLVSFVSMTLLYWTNYFKAETAYQVLHERLERGDAAAAAAAAGGTDVDSDEVTQQHHVPFGLLWRKLRLIVLAIFLTFSVTLVFPVFASSVELVHTGAPPRSFYHKSIFVPFVYLVWNLGDLGGRIACGFVPSFVVRRPRQLVVYSVLRLAFIPLFFTCNLHPYTAAGQLSALIESDSWYLLLQFLFGVLNGQLCTLCFMIVRDYCDSDDEKEAAGGFTTVFLSVGLAFGSVLSYLLVAAIN